jgi:hypothetical protein
MRALPFELKVKFHDLSVSHVPIERDSGCAFSLIGNFLKYTRVSQAGDRRGFIFVKSLESQSLLSPLLKPEKLKLHRVLKQGSCTISGEPFTKGEILHSKDKR